MSTTDWLNPLQHILNCQVRFITFSLSDWKGLVQQADTSWAYDDNRDKISEGNRAANNGRTWIVVKVSGNVVETLEIDGELKQAEAELITWTLQWNQAQQQSPKPSTLSESESFALKLSEWIQQQLESEEPSYSIPDHLTAGGKLFAEMIPFLLVTEYTNGKQASYPELEKLLRSFLAEDILLIPLKNQEWLIWGPVSLLKEADSEFMDDEDEETVEDSLTSICHGLHEMLASEWIGECHLAVAHPVCPAKGIVETTVLLRETINLGRKFHVGTSIHLPWMLQLERLLNAIPEVQRSRYLEHALKRTELFVEAEMLATLETFFSLDCNVSETAKKLYIHRNTLLYRLDKLKQETGLDVRQFRDAVLVKIILLLYKVTKRN
ncbi:PucR family transcriptional regulator [Paenibacillus sp. JDR-2]|uniref:PucR family transcriptional regulator n=1 Tax=Paenibacillus sp. (strain JDR-2) TaxID=324057 RepID=UPI0001667693|nr:helix-turn-helix domain-containing protein [Paenibacillus sp. JDR-2]ACS98831.1 putative transcriptional regulator, PucR family [Paenibacillus sp. JDR-2]